MIGMFFFMCLMSIASAVNVTVYAMNILAPCWAAPSYYPATCANLLDTSSRRGAILYFANNNKNKADFLTFQETQESENEWLRGQLGNQWYYFAAYHDDTYWASWITENPPFERNGVSIAVPKSKYDSCSFMDLPLGTGNHVAIAICRNILTNKMLRVASVHLDSDYGGRRKKESKSLRAWFGDEPGVYKDIIAGDFNAATDSGVIQSDLINGARFVDVLTTTGNPQQTHPYTTSYNSNGMWGPIDHVISRGLNVVPVESKIYDSGLWVTYPTGTGANSDPNEEPRICANLHLIGTDHFYISGKVEIGV